jgi:hypothetical protein
MGQTYGQGTISLSCLIVKYDSVLEMFGSCDDFVRHRLVGTIKPNMSLFLRIKKTVLLNFKLCKFPSMHKQLQNTECEYRINS